MRSKSYCVNLPPEAWSRVAKRPKDVYGNQEHNTIAYSLYLQQQHGNEEPFQTPIHLEATFFIKPPNLLQIGGF